MINNSLALCHFWIASYAHFPYPIPYDEAKVQSNLDSTRFLVLCAHSVYRGIYSSNCTRNSIGTRPKKTRTMPLHWSSVSLLFAVWERRIIFGEIWEYLRTPAAAHWPVRDFARKKKEKKGCTYIFLPYSAFPYCVTYGHLNALLWKGVGWWKTAQSSRKVREEGNVTGGSFRRVSELSKSCRNVREPLLRLVDLLQYCCI